MARLDTSCSEDHKGLGRLHSNPFGKWIHFIRIGMIGPRGKSLVTQGFSIQSSFQNDGNRWVMKGH